jgi:predicted amidohydrolase YtcJ
MCTVIRGRSGVSEWWHSGWLNSKALEVLGVDNDTPDPAPGIGMYARDEDGIPTGWVKEGAGWQHFAEHFEIKEDAHKLLHEQSMLAGLQVLSESGVTTLYDAGNFGFEDLIYGFMARLEQEGKLPVRYEGTYQIFSPDRVQFAIAEMKRYRKEYGGERLQFNTIKLFMDGINVNRAGAMLEPYADDPGYVGKTMLTAEELRDFLLELDEEEFDIHIHTMSDLAVRVVLDAVEAANDIANVDFYPRVTIAHLQLIDSADMPRIKELGVISNYTPWWFAGDSDDPLKIAFGEDRYGRTYMAKSLFESGATVTFSSDEWWGGELLWSYLSPYFGIQVGHTRQYPKEWREEGEDEIRPPDSERLSIEQLIVGYTRNGAYQMRMENSIGSIETGKLADLIVLDDNLFDIDSDEIWKVKPAAVVMEGKTVQGALSAASHN